MFESQEYSINTHIVLRHTDPSSKEKIVFFYFIVYATSVLGRLELCDEWISVKLWWLKYIVTRWKHHIIDKSISVQEQTISQRVHFLYYILIKRRLPNVHEWRHYPAESSDKPTLKIGMSIINGILSNVQSHTYIARIANVPVSSVILNWRVTMNVRTLGLNCHKCHEFSQGVTTSNSSKSLSVWSRRIIPSRGLET